MLEAVEVHGKAAEDMAQAEGLESQIQASMRSLLHQFMDQSDSLTFDGVRGLLEKDLGLETHALDAHKGFIKQCFSEYFDDDDSQIVQKITEEGDFRLPTDENLDEAEKVLKEHKEIEDVKAKTEPSKGMIRDSLLKRASHIKQNSETVTMAGVRRFLEEDMGLSKYALDPYKKYIAEQVGKVLEMDEQPVLESKITKAKSHSGDPASISNKKTSSDSSGRGDEEEEEEVKPKQKQALKEKTHCERINKRKAPPKEPKLPAKKQKLLKPKPIVQDEAVSDDSDDNKTHNKKNVKTPREVQAPSGKRVEHLKSVIKSCGMSVSPAVYKRVKQASEDKREAFMIKELEGMLSREGLSTNPSEKEIKSLKRRKEKEKELEGIDTSNIVSSTRRRATTSFVMPPIPEVPFESDEDGGNEDSDRNDEDGGSEDSDRNDEDDDENNDEEDGNEEVEGDNENNSEDGNENPPSEDDNEDSRSEDDNEGSRSEESDKENEIE